MSPEKVKEMIKHMCPMQSSFYRHTEHMPLEDQQGIECWGNLLRKGREGFAWLESYSQTAS